MYQFNSRVRFSELNYNNNNISITSIINYFQDCSTFQSEDLDIGLEYLNKKNRLWLLTGWQLEILSELVLGDNITIGTWPYKFTDLYGLRNFIIKNDNGKILAVANSIWVYIDTITNKPVRIPHDNAGYSLEPPYPMKYAPRKIVLHDNHTIMQSFTVKKSNIDAYNHVNNGQYIKMAEEFLTNDYKVSSMRVEYRNPAILGDIIMPKISHSENSLQVVLANKDDKIYAVVEFYKALQRDSK